MPDPLADDATLSGIPRLTRTLDRAIRAYGKHTELPVWMTEYGYQTDPPDKTIGVPFARQVAWLDDADFLAFRNPRIASFAQFLLFDDGPLTQYKPGDPRYWGTFQTGLVTGAGKHKPSYEAFKHPISVSRARAGRAPAARVRPAAHGSRRPAPDRGGAVPPQGLEDLGASRHRSGHEQARLLRDARSGAALRELSDRMGRRCDHARSRSARRQVTAPDGGNGSPFSVSSSR